MCLYARLPAAFCFFDTTLPCWVFPLTATKPRTLSSLRAALTALVQLWMCLYARLPAAFCGFPQSFAFAARHPMFIPDALMLSFSATFGQVFIYSTIFWFGALVFAATMNLRQLVSILVSVGYYAHPVTWLQWIGVALCFSGLFLKTYLGHLAYKEKEKKDGEKASP